LSIRIFYDSTKYRFPIWRKAKTVIEKVIRNENMVFGDLSFIITTDDILKGINKEFLKHNYYTDVIAFEYNFENVVNGEVYISIDTVKKNRHNYNVSLQNEMLRVMIHGVLHLTGFRDKSAKEKELMRRMEDRWIAEIEED